MNKALIFAVDDNPVALMTIGMAFENDFEVEPIESGERCLELLQHKEPALVLLDIGMEGIDGFETCRRLRETHDMPVIFVSAHDTLEERLLAFDCGGDDFIVKPYDPSELKHKAVRAVQRHVQLRKLQARQASLERIALDYQRDIGDTGLVLEFMRNSMACKEYEELAEQLLRTTTEYGVQCHVQIRHDGVSYTLTQHGPASELEQAVLERAAEMGRIFRFGRRMVLNYDFVSLLILNLPQDEAQIERIRNNLSTLVESAEAIAETISMRKESALRAEALQSASFTGFAALENLRESFRHQRTLTRLYLDELINNVERTYVFLGLTDSQEETVSSTLRAGAERILQLYEDSMKFDQDFQAVLDAMRPSKNDDSEVWL